MKKLHDIDGRGTSGETACIWGMLRKFHAVSPDGFPEDPAKDARYKAEGVFTKAELLDEIVRMEKVLGPDAESECRTVFCHNDALLENIVVDCGSDKVSFIDYEYGDTNYREYDIANHFGKTLSQSQFSF